MPKWIKSIYLVVLGENVPADKLAFLGVYESGKFKYRLWEFWKNPCGEAPKYSIQEFIRMKESIKNGRPNQKNV